MLPYKCKTLVVEKKEINLFFELKNKQIKME